MTIKSEGDIKKRYLQVMYTANGIFPKLITIELQGLFFDQYQLFSITSQE